MLCVEVLKLSGQVLPDDWNYFIRGATGAEINFPAKPDVSWLAHWQWLEACKLDFVLPAFRGLKDDLMKTPCWVQFGDNNVVSFVGDLSFRRTSSIQFLLTNRLRSLRHRVPCGLRLGLAF